MLIFLLFMQKQVEDAAESDELDLGYFINFEQCSEENGLGVDYNPTFTPTKRKQSD
ncbi:hypothetical protein AB1L07_05580 [Niallia alba]|uniref:hypothetical protein n=1 Tax=Niallia alba TaxID=2729105 RepID=UPI002E20E2E2|nr:hypothetical protein [Niallia alba]